MAATEILPAFSYACGMISAKLSHGERVLLENVFFSLSSGERLAVIGETGSGKTMLALSILGLLPSNVRMQGGCLQLDGAALPAGRQLQALRGDKLVYIPQNGAEFLLPARTVRKQLYDSLKKLGLPRKDFPALAAEKLRLAGFDAPETVLDKYPFQLSGGMAQRVTIALAACSRARLLIADEPTNGLDEAGRAQFFALLDSIFPDAAKLIITHDISVAARCDRVLVLCGGRTYAGNGRVKHSFKRSTPPIHESAACRAGRKRDAAVAHSARRNVRLSVLHPLSGDGCGLSERRDAKTYGRNVRMVVLPCLRSKTAANRSETRRFCRMFP